MVAQPENVRISLKMTAGLVVEAPFSKVPNMARGATPFRCKSIDLIGQASLIGGGLSD